ncbi:hypothetical protein E1258_09630 [Micromonospora sp. KC207]|uniref:hypothetical protein n=1 Tax=Micromonospora sp. KC207 TaxID=2530377 RepID=UPI00104FE596|nr:hypothetical protein [Micromonospora sp. KC207]TDC63896.1 hypothetical protein E1258_09630 [Micromonospora sp. KC207]
MQHPTGPWSIDQMRHHLNPPASLAVLAQTGTTRQARPTMAGAHLTHVTDPQHRALATAATLGRVTRGKGGEPLPVLRALARKGLLTLVPPPGRRFDVDHAVITEAGRRKLARLGQVAAEQAEREARVAKVLAFA